MHIHQVAPSDGIDCFCRDEIASCSERAYKQLSVPEAQKLMLFTSAKEALQFAEGVCTDLFHKRFL